MSETMAPTLTVSAYCDTKLGSLFQRQLPHLEDRQIHNDDNAPAQRWVSEWIRNITKQGPVAAWRLRRPVRSDCTCVVNCQCANKNSASNIAN